MAAVAVVEGTALMFFPFQLAAASLSLKDVVESGNLSSFLLFSFSSSQLATTGKWSGRLTLDLQKGTK